MGVVAVAVSVGWGAIAVAVGMAEGATVGVAVGNSATDVAVGAGAHVVNSEMLRHTIRNRDLMFLQRIAFRHRQVTIFAFLEFPQFQRPDGDPHQPQHAHVQRF